MRSEIIVDLKKLESNVEAVRASVKKGTKLMAVIKDDAYGHGAVEIAKYLTNKVEWFCVATLTEGIELRKGGVKNPVLIFESPAKERADQYVEYNLTASLSDMSSFEELADGTEYHLNFDTGMRRLGITPENAGQVFELMKKNRKMTCTGIYTHFSSSDEPQNESVEKQLHQFKKIRKFFPKHLLTHVANTGAIFHYKGMDVSFDAVRPGICLYGYMAGDVMVESLKPILSWKSFVMQTRLIKKGESVGYGQSWIAPEDGVVGTIPVGYGDGLMRILSGKFRVKINGKLVQQVGRVSMDYFGIYSSDASSFVRGDDVYLLDGEELNAKIWADEAGTIAYEITTFINKKNKKKYLF